MTPSPKVSDERLSKLLDHYTSAIAESSSPVFKAHYTEHRAIIDELLRLRATADADARDAARLNWLDAKVKRSGEHGYQWSTWEYVCVPEAGSAREQIDAELALLSASSAGE